MVWYCKGNKITYWSSNSAARSQGFNGRDPRYPNSSRASTKLRVIYRYVETSRRTVSVWWHIYKAPNLFECMFWTATVYGQRRFPNSANQVLHINIIILSNLDQSFKISQSCNIWRMTWIPSFCKVCHCDGSSLLRQSFLLLWHEYSLVTRWI